MSRWFQWMLDVRLHGGIAFLGIMTAIAIATGPHHERKVEEEAPGSWSDRAVVVDSGIWAYRVPDEFELHRNKQSVTGHEELTPLFNAQ